MIIKEMKRKHPQKELPYRTPQEFKGRSFVALKPGICLEMKKK